MATICLFLLNLTAMAQSTMGSYPYGHWSMTEHPNYRAELTILRVNRSFYKAGGGIGCGELYIYSKHTGQKLYSGILIYQNRGMAVIVGGEVAKGDTMTAAYQFTVISNKGVKSRLTLEKYLNPTKTEGRDFYLSVHAGGELNNYFLRDKNAKRQEGTSYEWEYYRFDSRFDLGLVPYDRTVNALTDAELLDAVQQTLDSHQRWLEGFANLNRFVDDHKHLHSGWEVYAKSKTGNDIEAHTKESDFAPKVSIYGSETLHVQDEHEGWICFNREYSSKRYYVSSALVTLFNIPRPEKSSADDNGSRQPTNTTGTTPPGGGSDTPPCGGKEENDSTNTPPIHKHEYKPTAISFGSPRQVTETKHKTGKYPEFDSLDIDNKKIYFLKSTSDIADNVYIGLLFGDSTKYSTKELAAALIAEMNDTLTKHGEHKMLRFPTLHEIDLLWNTSKLSKEEDFTDYYVPNSKNLTIAMENNENVGMGLSRSHVELVETITETCACGQTREKTRLRIFKNMAICRKYIATKKKN